MYRIAYISVTIFSILYCVEGAPSGCALNTNKDLPKKNEPLLLIKDKGKEYKLVRPDAVGKEGFIQLKTGQEILLACPGSRNYINETRQEFSHALCQNGRLLSINDQVYESEQLDCTNRVIGSILKTSAKCHKNKGTILEMGFKSQGWHPLVSVCHDIANSHTFYVIHTVHGSALPGKVYRGTRRPAFSRGEKFLYYGFSPEKTYNRQNQIEVLNNVLGQGSTDTYLDNKVLFLARGHLAPDADFLLSPTQLLTYFYINVAPQWQSINAGNWLAVEMNTRKVATKLGADLEVATGTHGIIKLKDNKGKTKELYLESNSKVPVPEYYWKLIRNPKDNSCMGFITTNNPHISSPPKHKCQDICKQYNWPILQDKNELTKGYVYCCDYDSIRKAIPEVPDLKCSQPLKF